MKTEKNTGEENVFLDYWDDLKKGKSAKFAVYIFSIGGFFLILIPLILTMDSPFGLDFMDTGQIGDTIGGTVTPFIAFGGMILTFFAFWVQFRANQYQRDDIRKERFENRFFEMLRIHDQNVAGIEISNGRKGRRAMEDIFFELLTIFSAFSKYLDKWSKENPTEAGELFTSDFDLRETFRYAYYAFFLGGRFSDESLYFLPEAYHTFYTDFSAELEKKIKENEREEDGDYFITVPITWDDLESGNTYLGHKIFEGYVESLGLYYRHLFHSVKYVVEADDILFTRGEKYQYIKMLRSKLSSHEQLLVYYSALSDFGEPWIEAGYLTEWRVIKNLPIPIH